MRCKYAFEADELVRKMQMQQNPTLRQQEEAEPSQ
jgi:hypothetical protein